ncbi:hypothetical protein [Lactobacillus helveticus]|uniref:hypothetical protein n=1 Tax=Lactobacillus helveticus TaxID=1587 RepID=UPI001F11EE57|nr:hypothetical protein [Lactobacillus helveticus]
MNFEIRMHYQLLPFVAYRHLDEINEFWKKDFSFLFKNPNFINSLVGTTNKEFENLVLNKLKDQYSTDVDNRNFNILIDEVDNMAHNIELTASKVINNQATKKELLSAIDQGIQNLQFAKENFFLSEDSKDKKMTSNKACRININLTFATQTPH